jgi:hypothetical protein
MGATELALDATGTLLMISDSYEEPFIIFSREKGSQGRQSVGLLRKQHKTC